MPNPRPSIVAAAPSDRPRDLTLEALIEHAHAQSVLEPVVRFANLELDRERLEVRRDGRLIAFTPTEFRLLELFLDNPRRVLPRSHIFLQVWRFDFGPVSNLLHVYVGYVRRKLGEPRLIHTVRGIGYVLREPYPS
jgi:two-component system response regulator MprA